MTPYDILRALKNDLLYVAPEETDIKIKKVTRAIRAVEKIHASGVMTEGAYEAIEVIAELRKLEAMLRLGE